MARNKMYALLKRPDKGVSNTSGVGGTLSGLWRKILLDIDMQPTRFIALLTEYVRDARNEVPNNSKDQSSTQGNLIKEFVKQDMTWKVFCKGLRFLQFTKFEISLKCYKKDGSHSIHTFPVNLYDEAEDLMNLNEQTDSKDEESRGD